MSLTKYNSFTSRALIVFYYVFSLCCVLVLMIVFSSLRWKPVEETITVNPDRVTSVPMPSTPVGRELPLADRDIERVGDRVAAAVIYLKRRENEPALNALEQAKAATARALTRKADKGNVRDQLLATSQQIESAKDLIRKGKIGNATRELKEVDQKLESVSY